MKQNRISALIPMVVTLFAIALVCSALLGVVNAVTEERIAENRAAAQQAAMEAVLPGAASFRDVTDRLDADFLAENPVTGIYEAAGRGYVVTAAPKGFGGEIEMTVGVDTDGAITGVVITDLSETPGLGARATEPAFLAQFAGKSGAFSVVKGAAGDNQISAITGATVTSRAVTAGALAAVKAVQAAA